MRSDDDPTALLLAESAGAFLKTHHSQARIRALKDAGSGLERALWGQMAEAGWLSLRLPEALGGAGLGLRQSLALAEAFGAALLPEPFVEAVLAPSALLAGLPGNAAIEAVAAGIADGSAVTAVAWQERPGGIDPAITDCRVETTGAGLLLHGRKRFVCGEATQLLVTARQNGELMLLRVDAGGPGLATRAFRKAEAGNLLDVDFDGVALRLDHVLGRGPALETALTRMLDEVQVFLGAQLAALGRAALTASVTYMRRREQFGQTLASFQALRHRVVDIHLQLLLAESSCRKALRLLEAGADDASAAASAAKARGAGAGLKAARDAIQLHGGMGYAEESGMGLHLRAALRLATLFGSADAHRLRFLSLLTPAEAA